MTLSFNQALTQLRQEFPKYLLEVTIKKPGEGIGANFSVDASLTALSAYAAEEDSKENITEGELQKAKKLLGKLIHGHCSNTAYKKKRERLESELKTKTPWRLEWGFFTRRAICAEHGDVTKAKEMLADLMRGYETQEKTRVPEETEPLKKPLTPAEYFKVDELPDETSDSLQDMAEPINQLLQNKLVIVTESDRTFTYHIGQLQWYRLGVEGSLQLLIGEFHLAPHCHPLFSKRELERLFGSLVKGSAANIQVRVDPRKGDFYVVLQAADEDEEETVYHVTVQGLKKIAGFVVEEASRKIPSPPSCPP